MSTTKQTQWATSSDRLDQTRVTKMLPQNIRSSAMLKSMDFLNSAPSLYPQAISLAAGRPPDDLLEPYRTQEFISNYRRSRVRDGLTEADSWIEIGQYAATNGLISSFLRDALCISEDISFDIETINTYNGFQEALVIELLSISSFDTAIICFDPTYVGLAGAAMVAKTPLYVVHGPPSAEGIREAARQARNDGYSVLATYIIPDYSNPEGATISLEERIKITDIIDELDIIVYEDTAYRVFNYLDTPPPTLFKLSNSGRVVYLGTLSKSFMPGVRIGFAARRRKDPDLDAYRTAVKSFVSVTTSPIAQAIAAGFLLSCDGNLYSANKARIDYCNRNRELMLGNLDAHLKNLPGASWSEPHGGFFISVELPFEFGDLQLAELIKCHDVIVVPMSYFSIIGAQKKRVRLSFSSASPANIVKGTSRFCEYCVQKFRLEQLS